MGLFKKEKKRKENSMKGYGVKNKSPVICGRAWVGCRGRGGRDSSITHTPKPRELP